VWAGDRRATVCREDNYRGWRSGLRLLATILLRGTGSFFAIEIICCHRVLFMVGLRRLDDGGDEYHVQNRVPDELAQPA